mgnify:CR=1 FL=1
MTRNPIIYIYKVLTEGDQPGDIKELESYYRIQDMDVDEYRFSKYYHWMI